MERVRFGAEAAWTPPDARLERVTIARLTEPLAAGADVQAAVFRLGPGGRIARHPATMPQLLADRARAREPGTAPVPATTGADGTGIDAAQAGRGAGGRVRRRHGRPLHP